MAIQFDASSLPLTLPSTPSPAAPASGAAEGFGAALEGLLARVDASAGDANTAVSQMLDGNGDVHDAMIALQRAESTLELTLQIRNKFVQAYQDIMRMPV
jgi:flagellar hook-basal body complex protein FliE